MSAPRTRAAAPDTVEGGDQSLVRSSGVVAVGTLASRVTGLVRTILTAGAFGTVGIAYSYNLANNTPNMIYDLLLGGILSATLVPILVTNRDTRDDNGTDAVLTVATVGLFVITMAAVVLAPQIIGLYSKIGGLGADPPTQDQQELAVMWMRLFAPQILFYGLATLGTAFLNAHRRFAAAAVAPVVNNAWMIVLLIIARQLVAAKTVSDVSDSLGLVVLIGLGTTLGIVAMALVLWPAIARAELRWRWRFDLDDPSVRRLVRMSGWTLGYVVANQVTLFVIIGLAGKGVSTWNYAYQFFQLPYGVFTVSVMTTFTPELASLAAQGARVEFNRRFLQGLRLVCLVILPSTVLFVVLARPMVWALFVQIGGRFTAADVGPTASTIAAFSWGLVGFSLYLYILRGFYARKDTRTPFLVNLGENALTLVLAFTLGSRSGFVPGVDGLAWAWSLAYWISAVAAFVLLRRQTGPFGVKVAAGTTAPLARMLLATVVTGIAVTALAHVLPDSGGGTWATLIVAGGLGLALYIGLCIVLGVREISELPRLILRR